MTSRHLLCHNCGPQHAPHAGRSIRRYLIGFARHPFEKQMPDANRYVDDTLDNMKRLGRCTDDLAFRCDQCGTIMAEGAPAVCLTLAPGLPDTEWEEQYIRFCLDENVWRDLANRLEAIKRRLNK